MLIFCPPGASFSCMVPVDDLKADEQAFLQSVRASKRRMEDWPDWKKQAAAATRVSETPRATGPANHAKGK